jgi:hypothetical protein
MAAGKQNALHRQASGWRARLRRRISWSLLLKLIALLTLWALFFSPQDRIEVNAGSVAGRLAAEPTPTPAIQSDQGTDHD